MSAREGCERCLQGPILASWSCSPNDSSRCQIVRAAMKISCCTYNCTSLFYFLFRANILLDRHYNAKLGDFGFARQLPKVTEGRTLVTAPIFAKSLGYFPPELQEMTKHSPKSDMYSYGVVSPLRS